jgi:hypothetical protein
MAAAGPALADVFGSVEPFASTSVLDIGPLVEADLDVRAAFAERIMRCGLVDDVEDLLADERVTTTIDARNTRFDLSAGGFAGSTNPTFAFTVKDGGRRPASLADVQLLGDALGFVTSQDSVFLLDSESTGSLDFPASYVVLRFHRKPSLEQSAALFETVGRIDPELFETDTSGYTQFGRSYLSLQSDVPAEQFIAGYVQAAEETGVEYTPIVDGQPALFQGSAAFPGNDWVAHPRGEDYLARLPVRIHDELRRLRQVHLRFTRQILAELRRGHADDRELEQFLRHLDCR